MHRHVAEGKDYTLEFRMRSRELAVLNSLAEMVNRLLDLSDIMQSALQKTMEASGAEAGAACRLEEQTQTLVLMAQPGLSERFVSRTFRLPLEIEPAPSLEGGLTALVPMAAAPSWPAFT